MQDCFAEPKGSLEIPAMPMICPKCNDQDIRRSHRRWMDFLLGAFGLVPFRCNTCLHRFFRFRASLFKGTIG